MPFKREDGIIARHPLAVIRYAQKAPSAGLNVNGYPSRAGVDRVFYKLFRNRRWPLNHFARGDLICQVI
jgi:hypothetical protein